MAEPQPEPQHESQPQAQSQPTALDYGGAKCSAVSGQWWKKHAAPAVGHSLFFGAAAGLLGAIAVCAFGGVSSRDPKVANILARGVVGGAAALTATLSAVTGFFLSM